MPLPPPAFAPRMPGSDGIPASELDMVGRAMAVASDTGTQHTAVDEQRILGVSDASVTRFHSRHCKRSRTDNEQVAV